MIVKTKILWILSFVQMSKFFSHFGIRTLLVLYMVNQLNYADSHAYGINAVFCSLCELGGIFGGILADRYLGFKKSIVIGGWILALGYLCISLENMFFLSLGLAVAGSSLFSGNIIAMLGLVYAENNQECKKGFTFFYMLQNLGALASTITCGLIAAYYGFQAALIIASLGIICGNLVLFRYRKILPDLSYITVKNNASLSVIFCVTFLCIAIIAMFFEKLTMHILPWMTLAILGFFMFKLLRNRSFSNQVYSLFIYLVSIVLFFAMEDQICSSLLLFAERETNRQIMGWTIPSAFITIMNPIIILLCGAFIARRHFHMIMPFILMSFAFGLLSALCLLNISISIFMVIGVVMMISIAELMIGPLVLSCASEIAAKGNSGMIMGLVPIAFSLAFQLSGVFSKSLTVENSTLSFESYGRGFGLVALGMLIGGVGLQFLTKRFSDAKHTIY